MSSVSWLQAAAKHRQAVKDRKKANQEKSAQVQKVGGTHRVEPVNGDGCRWLLQEYQGGDIHAVGFTPVAPCITACIY